MGRRRNPSIDSPHRDGQHHIAQLAVTLAQAAALAAHQQNGKEHIDIEMFDAIVYQRPSERRK